MMVICKYYCSITKTNRLSTNLCSYYYNEELDESRWTAPLLLGNGWVEHTDDNGDVYFYNEDTDESKVCILKSMVI
jgi:hypothetical protein